MKKKDVDKICEILGIDAYTFRIGLKDGKFPFGACIGQASYVLYPPKVYEYTGYKMENFKDVKI